MHELSQFLLASSGWHSLLVIKCHCKGLGRKKYAPSSLDWLGTLPSVMPPCWFSHGGPQVSASDSMTSDTDCCRLTWLAQMVNSPVPGYEGHWRCPCSLLCACPNHAVPTVSSPLSKNFHFKLLASSPLGMSPLSLSCYLPIVKVSMSSPCPSTWDHNLLYNHTLDPPPKEEFGLSRKVPSRKVWRPLCLVE